MTRHTAYLTLSLATVFAAGYLAGHRTPTVHAAGSKVYELRVYHTFPGKLDDLLARFRDHTMTIFDRHGMHNVAYWVPIEEPQKDKTLYYVISHDSREAARQNWAAFGADPEWKKVSKESEVNGKIVEKVDSTFLEATDFSPMK